MNKTRVYRSGTMQAPAERGCERSSYELADAERPLGRQGRMDGIFASPNLTGVIRWVRGNHLCNFEDVKVREITVDADTVYVYSVRAWEAVGGYTGEKAIPAYWATGFTLTEWMTLDLHPAEWELLLGQNDIISSRPVGRSRVAAAGHDQYETNELLKILK